MAKPTRSGAAAVIARLRETGLRRYPGAHTKSPWPGHLDLAVKDKTFAFLSAPGDPPGMSLKLPLSRSLALQLPGSQPTPYGLGKSGWVSLSFDGHEPPPMAQLESWLDESYRSIAPKKLLQQFLESIGEVAAAPASGTKRSTKSGKKKAPATTSRAPRRSD